MEGNIGDQKGSKGEYETISTKAKRGIVMEGDGGRVANLSSEEKEELEKKLNQARAIRNEAQRNLEVFHLDTVTNYSPDEYAKKEDTLIEIRDVADYNLKKLKEKLGTEEMASSKIGDDDTLARDTQEIADRVLRAAGVDENGEEININ